MSPAIARRSVSDRTFCACRQKPAPRTNKWPTTDKTRQIPHFIFMLADFPVPSVEIKQRVARACAFMQLHDLRQKNIMIAAFINRRPAANHPTKRMFQQRRCSLRAPRYFSARPDVPEIGKVARNVFLSFAENVDGKCRGLFKKRIHMRRALEAKQHEGRLQRDRGERIDRYADRAAAPIASRQHRNAGGETAHKLSERAGIEHRKSGSWLSVRE